MVSQPHTANGDYDCNHICPFCSTLLSLFFLSHPISSLLSFGIIFCRSHRNPIVPGVWESIEACRSSKYHLQSVPVLQEWIAKHLLILDESQLYTQSYKLAPLAQKKQ